MMVYTRRTTSNENDLLVKIGDIRCREMHHGEGVRGEICVESLDWMLNAVNDEMSKFKEL